MSTRRTRATRSSSRGMNNVDTTMAGQEVASPVLSSKSATSSANASPSRRPPPRRRRRAAAAAAAAAVGGDQISGDDEQMNGHTDHVMKTESESNAIVNGADNMEDYSSPSDNATNDAPASASDMVTEQSNEHSIADNNDTTNNSNKKTEGDSQIDDDDDDDDDEDGEETPSAQEYEIRQEMKAVLDGMYPCIVVVAVLHFSKSLSPPPPSLSLTSPPPLSIYLLLYLSLPSSSYTGTHQLLQQHFKSLDDIEEEQLKHAETRKKSRLVEVEHQYQSDLQQAHQECQEEKNRIRTKMMADLEEQLRVASQNNNAQSNGVVTRKKATRSTKNKNAASVSKVNFQLSASEISTDLDLMRQRFVPQVARNISIVRQTLYYKGARIRTGVRAVCIHSASSTSVVAAIASIHPEHVCIYCLAVAAVVIYWPVCMCHLLTCLIVFLSCLEPNTDICCYTRRTGITYPVGTTTK
jgi:hypothetical protein